MGLPETSSSDGGCVGWPLHVCAALVALHLPRPGSLPHRIPLRRPERLLQFPAAAGLLANVRGRHSGRHCGQSGRLPVSEFRSQSDTRRDW
jgi:hypothetical protein